MIEYFEVPAYPRRKLSKTNLKTIIVRKMTTPVFHACHLLIQNITKN